MKLLILITITLYFLSGCAEDDKEDAFSCSAPPSDIVEAQVGNYRDDFPSMQREPDSVYLAEPYCRETYNFRQYNKNDGGWCYYYQIDVSCNENATPYITDIYYSED